MALRHVALGQQPPVVGDRDRLGRGGVGLVAPRRPARQGGRLGRGVGQGVAVRDELHLDVGGRRPDQVAGGLSPRPLGDDAVADLGRAQVAVVDHDARVALREGLDERAGLGRGGAAVDGEPALRAGRVDQPLPVVLPGRALGCCRQERTGHGRQQAEPQQRATADRRSLGAYPRVSRHPASIAIPRRRRRAGTAAAGARSRVRPCRREPKRPSASLYLTSRARPHPCSRHRTRRPPGRPPPAPRTRPAGPGRRRPPRPWSGSGFAP